MKILSNKRYAAEMAAARENGAAAQAKGYYGATTEEFNAYLDAISVQMRGAVQIQPLDQVGRNQLREIYMRNGPVFGVINKIASAIAAVSPYLELIDRQTGDAVTNHPVVRLLDRPNDRYSRRKFFYGVATNRYLFGDQWTYCIRNIGKNRDPRELYIVPSWRVGTKFKPGEWDGRLEDGIFEGILVNGKQIAAREVFENFAYNIDDGTFFGVSKVSVAASYLTVMERAVAREATALKNGGAANIIAPADTSVPALPQDVDSTEERVNKSGNANKTLMLRIPVAVHSLGDKPADLTILESHKDAVTALCFVFEIPVDLYYGQSKYENAKEAKKALYESVAIPFLEEWGEDLLSFLRLTDRYELRVNTDKIDVLHEDPYTVGENLAKIGAFTTNEIREATGWGRIEEPWADEVRLPLGIQLGNDPVDFSEE